MRLLEGISINFHLPFGCGVRSQVELESRIVQQLFGIDFRECIKKPRTLAEKHVRMVPARKSIRSES